MSKLAALLVLVTATAPAYADIVEPTVELEPPSAVEPTPAVEPTALEPNVPPLSGGRIAGEALLGGLFAVGGGIGGGYIGASIEVAGGCSGDFCGLGGAILGGLAGLTVAAPVGVYLAGSHGGQTGSFGATLGGSVIGTLVGIGAVASSETEGAWPLLVIAPVVGSMIGFNVTRKYDETHRKRRTWAPVASVSSGGSTFGVAGAF